MQNFDFQPSELNESDSQKQRIFLIAAAMILLYKNKLMTGGMIRLAYHVFEKFKNSLSSQSDRMYPAAKS